MDERSGVRDTYDRIADHFSVKRENTWPEVERFCTDRRAETALDIGCGNGRHTELLAERADRAIGLDMSRELLALARERAPTAECITGDAASLPIADDSIGLAVYVATVHHLPTRELRIQSLDELARVLTSDGSALVSAWSLTHDRFDGSEADAVGFDTEVDFTLPDGETVPRFYHIYAPVEFEADIAGSGLTAVDSFLSSGNCYAVVEPDG
jgi:ubiquinone/menaquinone biosynthesis C-methylase UbiE